MSKTPGIAFNLDTKTLIVSTAVITTTAVVTTGALRTLAALTRPPVIKLTDKIQKVSEKLENSTK